MGLIVSADGIVVGVNETSVRESDNGEKEPVGVVSGDVCGIQATIILTTARNTGKVNRILFISQSASLDSIKRVFNTTTSSTAIGQQPVDN